MEMNKALDNAIMMDETSKSPCLSAGYIANKKVYDNYLSNDSWEAFVKDMEKNYPTAFAMYGLGGGKELEERKVGANVYPPKMASFGSSSRMIYNLFKEKEVDGFLFEKKLPTTVGGTANLDGFMETEQKYVFIEAKCREPYTKKSSSYERKYEGLYRAITESPKTSVVCKIDIVDDKKMDVRFMVGNTEIHTFDLKQMISHLLGVATALLKDTLPLKKLDFIYLLFNPTLIELADAKEKIRQIYTQTYQECNAVDFQALYEVIVDYLQTVHKLGADKDKKAIISHFTFRLCDQQNVIL